MIQWKPGLLLTKVRVTTHHLCHWKEQWHLLYTFLYGICSYVFGRQQTAGKIMNIMFFTTCLSALRFLNLTWIFEKWETYIIYNFNKLLVGKLCGCLMAKFQSTDPECSTSQQHREETSPMCEVAEEPLCKASAVCWAQPLQFSLARVRCKCRGNGVGTKELPSTWAQTSREPCALRALNRAPSVTPPQASLQRFATAACS